MSMNISLLPPVINNSAVNLDLLRKHLSDTINQLMRAFSAGDERYPQKIIGSEYLQSYFEVRDGELVSVALPLNQPEWKRFWLEMSKLNARDQNEVLEHFLISEYLDPEVSPFKKKSTLLESREGEAFEIPAASEGSITEEDQENIRFHLERAFERYAVNVGKKELKERVFRFVKNPVEFMLSKPRVVRSVNGALASPKHLAALHEIQKKIGPMELHVVDGHIKLIGAMPATSKDLVHLIHAVLGEGDSVYMTKHNKKESSLLKSLLSGNWTSLVTLGKYVDLSKIDSASGSRVYFSSVSEGYQRMLQMKVSREYAGFRLVPSNAGGVVDNEHVLGIKEKQLRWQEILQEIERLNDSGCLKHAVNTLLDKVFVRSQLSESDRPEKIALPRLVRLPSIEQNMEFTPIHTLVESDVKLTQLIEGARAKLETLRERFDFIQYENIGKRVSTKKQPLSVVLSEYKRLAKKEVTIDDFVTDHECGKLSSIKAYVEAWFFRSVFRNMGLHCLRENLSLELPKSLEYLVDTQEQINEVLNKYSDEHRWAFDVDCDNLHVLLEDYVLKARDILKYESGFRLGFGRIRRKAFERYLNNNLGIEERTPRGSLPMKDKTGVLGWFNRLRAWIK